MTLETIYTVSQIIAAIAVILSLVPLVISIRQNTKAQLTASVEGLTAAITAINVPAMQSPELGDALSRVREDWWVPHASNASWPTISCSHTSS